MAFMNSDVSSITIPEGIEKIGVRAFYKSHELIRADFPESLEVICDEAFRECGELNNVALYKTKFIGFETFRMCYSFTSVVIPDTVPSLREGSFRVCSGVKTLVIGSGITEIPKSTFDYYNELETVEFRGKITSVGDSAFYIPTNRASSLVSISLLYVEHIGNSAFSGRITLSDIDLGDHLKTIGKSAFRDCRSIEAVHLPATLKSIGDEAFLGCRDLTDVYFEGKAPAMGIGVFAGTEAELHYTASSDFPFPTAVIVATLILIVAAAIILLKRSRNGRNG
jgi:hypothetical protein